MLLSGVRAVLRGLGKQATGLPQLSLNLSKAKPLPAFHSLLAGRPAFHCFRQRNVMDSAGLLAEDLASLQIGDSGGPDFVYQLAFSWYCYWDGSYGLPVDPTKDYNFRPPLATSSSGCLIPRQGDATALLAVDGAGEALAELREWMAKFEVRPSQLGPAP